MSLAQAYIGCDIAKQHFDVFDPTAPKSRQHSRLANTGVSARAFAKALAGRPGAFVVLEATGAYDRVLRRALAKAGVAFHVANPLQTRHFARAKGLLAKTDRLDAAMLATYGQAMAPQASTRCDPERERLAAWVRRRDQLVAIRAEERTRIQTAEPELQPSFASLVTRLDELIARAEAKIKTLTQASAELDAQHRLLITAPGVGPVTAMVLLSEMPELGRSRAKAIAALAGLAPMNQDSGAFRGLRRIQGGRRRVRKALYMAALQAKQKGRFKRFYDRVLAANGSGKAAIIAVARKLLTILNAMLKNQTPYAP